MVMIQLSYIREGIYLDKICIISKKKVILTYFIIASTMVSIFLTMFSDKFIIITVGLIILFWLIVIKYMKCSHCEHILTLRELSYFDYKYCRHCGTIIYLE